MLRRLLSVLLAVFLTVAVLPPANAASLQPGDSGDQVLQLKQRMFELGYFNSDQFSSKYNDTTAERVRRLQKNNGLTQTGKVTEELWDLIFSDRCVAADGTVRTSADPEPAAVSADEAADQPSVPADVSAPLDVPGAPERDGRGFLTEKTEFAVQDVENGFWAYLSETLQVVIHRYWDSAEKVYWFACDIRTAGEERIRSLYSGGRYLYPRSLARANRAVLAFNDDNHDYRKNKNIPVGIVIRNGTVLSSKTKKPSQGGFPKLEVLACFSDSSMKCYNTLDHTAQEFLDMGAEQVIAFGPILVTDGHLGEHMHETEEEARKEGYYHYREPRIALGMVEPGHYIVIDVTGKYMYKRAQVPGTVTKGNSTGVYLDWLALKMLELGASEAINLDGSWTTSLCFLGESLNMKYSSSRKARYLLSFGVSDLTAKD